MTASPSPSIRKALYLPPLLELPLPKELVCRHLLIVAESRPLIFVSPVTEYFSRKEEQHILSWFVSFRVRGINSTESGTCKLWHQSRLDWIAPSS